MSGFGALVACSGDSNDFNRRDGDTGGSGGSSGASGGRSGSGGAITGGSGGSSGSVQGGSGGTAAGQGGTAGTSGGSGGVGGSSGDGQGGNAGDDQGGNGGDGGACTSTNETTRRHGQRGRSSGFSGTDAQYSQLYDVPCASPDDCQEPCVMRGGTTAMCAASICVDSTSDYCLPPTVWRNTSAIRSEGTDTSDGAVLTLVANPYEDFLLVDDFKFEVPEAAEIMGITVTIRRAGGNSMDAADGAVRLIKNGAIGQADRSLPTPWTGPEFVNVDYGGATDRWGETWTPADVNSTDFGVALSAIYTGTAGNGRAYVDIVYATIHYRTTCD